MVSTGCVLRMRRTKEKTFIHAQKEQNNVVLNGETTRIDGNRTEEVGKSESISIGENLTVKVTRGPARKRPNRS